MNITKKQYQILKDVYNILPTGKAFFKQDVKTQEIILKYDQLLIALEKKRKQDNKRIAQYIADKRKEDKNYAR